MYVKDPYLFVIRVEHRVSLAGFCLSLFSLHMLNRDVKMTQAKKERKKQTKKQTKLTNAKKQQGDLMCNLIQFIKSVIDGLTINKC